MRLKTTEALLGIETRKLSWKPPTIEGLKTTEALLGIETDLPPFLMPQ